MVADARNKPPLIDERTDNISTHGPVGNAASARRAMRGVIARAVRETLPLSSEGRGLPHIETNVQKSALETAAIRPSDSGFKPEMQFVSNLRTEN